MNRYIAPGHAPGPHRPARPARLGSVLHPTADCDRGAALGRGTWYSAPAGAEAAITAEAQGGTPPMTEIGPRANKDGTRSPSLFEGRVISESPRLLCRRVISVR